jgi:tetrahydromethanopterin S-methyltransferase subunit G
MAKQPENLVVRILRDIQRTQAEHTKRLDHIEDRLDGMNGGVVAALGLATRADIRHEAVDKRLKELETLVAQLGNRRRCRVGERIMRKRQCDGSSQSKATEN